MLKSWFCVLLLIIISNGCLGNNMHPEGVSHKVLFEKTGKNDTLTDTAVINKWTRLANDYRTKYPDSTIYYINKVIADASKTGYQKGIAEAYLVVVPLYLSQAKYTLVEKCLKEAIAIYATLNDQVGLSNAYRLYGNLYNQTGKYQNALGYLKKALKIKLSINDSLGLAKTYLSIGNVYDNLGFSSTSLDYYFKSLNINTALHNNIAISATYNNIGVILKSLELYPQSLLYFNKALAYWKQMRSEGGIATAYQNIGEVLVEQKKYDQAIRYLLEVLRIGRQQDDKEGIGSASNYLGVCYLYKKEYKKALSYLETSLQVAVDNQLDVNKATSLNSLALYYNVTADYKKAYDFSVKAKALSNTIGNTSLRINAYTQLINALGGLNKYKEVYTAQKEFDRVNNSFKKDESVQKFTSYSLEYTYANKERQRMLQQKANNLLYQQKIHRHQFINIIAAIIVSGMIITAIVYYRQKLKQQKINVELTRKNEQVLSQKIDLDNQAKELNDLNKLKDRLISILAHDLRSPLSTLRGMFSLLNDETITHEELLEMMPQVLKQLEFTSDFLDTLLFWINSQMSDFNYSVKSFLVRDMLKEVDNCYGQAAAKGILLHINIADDLTALADPNSIRIVIRNLVTNAIKFSGPGDTITISAKKQDQQVLFTVKDTGTGMAPAQRDMLFKKKVDSQIGTENESGTGMGLLFCKDLIYSCKGRIWLESEVGVGSTFFFTIPVSETQEV